MFARTRGSRNTILNRNLILEECHGDVSILKRKKEIAVNSKTIESIDNNAFFGLKNLEVIQIHETKITEIDKPKFSGLNLRELHLDDNKLKRIHSDSFKELKFLKKLDLSVNLLSKIDNTSFSSLHNIRELFLNRNELKTIESSVFKGLRYLEKLDLSFNSIETIHKNSFEDLSNLKELHLGENKLISIQKETFIGLKNLKKLDLSFNSISKLERQALAHLSNLKELYFNQNKLAKTGYHDFRGLNKLEKLDLSQNGLMEVDANSFVDLTGLKELYLDRNKLKRIDNESFRGLVSLEKLDLFENDIAGIDSRAFSEFRDLKELYLLNNQLASVERSCFEPLKSIRLIDLRNNRFESNIVSYFDKDSYPEGTIFWDPHMSIFGNRETFEKSIIGDAGTNLKWNLFLRQFQKTKIDSVSDYTTSGQIVSSEKKKTPTVTSGTQLFDRYKTIDKIGSGSFGEVYLVEDVVTNQKKSMKMFRTGLFTDVDAVLKEIGVLASINHQNIVKYYDHFTIKSEGSNSLALIMEYCENGDLRDQIVKAKISGEKLPNVRIFNWIYQSTDGLRYLHKNSIIHRDIKPQNLLLNKKDEIKIADFGVAVKEDLSDSSFAGTFSYMSPEMTRSAFDASFRYSFNTDIWSLGCVLYELIFLQMAFSQGFLRANIAIPDITDAGVFKPILSGMLEKDPICRIGSEELGEKLTGLKETFRVDEIRDASSI